MDTKENRTRFCFSTVEMNCLLYFFVIYNITNIEMQTKANKRKKKNPKTEGSIESRSKNENIVKKPGEKAVPFFKAGTERKEIPVNKN